MEQTLTTELQITDEFLATRPLSYSALKEFRRSPAHYMLYLKRPKITTPEMMLGKVVDCLVLEPERFDDRFVIFAKPNLRTNNGKAEMLRITTEAKEAHKELIYQETVDLAMKCKTALLNHPIAASLINNRKHTQLKLTWTDKGSSLPMIGYADFDTMLNDQWFIVDLKTTNSADPDDFIKQAAKLDYQIQCGAYCEGYPRKYFRFPGFIFLCVETDEPYNVSVMYCDNKYIQEAKDEFKGTLNAFRYCMDNNQFDLGYDFRLMGSREYFSMDLPKYKKSKFTTV